MYFLNQDGPSWSYGSWIYNYLCNQYLSSPTLWVRIPLRRSVLNTTLCDKVCQWLATGQWFSWGTLVSSTNKTDLYDITEILLKVALSTRTVTSQSRSEFHYIIIWFLILRILSFFGQIAKNTPKFAANKKEPTLKKAVNLFFFLNVLEI